MPAIVEHGEATADPHHAAAICIADPFTIDDGAMDQSGLGGEACDTKRAAPLARGYAAKFSSVLRLPSLPRLAEQAARRHISCTVPAQLGGVIVLTWIVAA
jgi:hypothetical protein